MGNELLYKKKRRGGGHDEELMKGVNGENKRGGTNVWTVMMRKSIDWEFIGLGGVCGVR
jgi:hypothetical protein